MSASAGTIGYRPQSSANGWKWAALALVTAAALVGGLFIGRALAPSPTQPVRTIVRVVPATGQATFTNDAAELATVKAAFGRSISSLGLQAPGGAAPVKTAKPVSANAPASVHVRQLAP